ncbi:LacI family DNA-binding transcriptional regulator [Liquorilactobacillus vini]|uniref:Maltose operon transcriptional repressor n=1 Tax=Liquorilactobacillus vini DSM 20605 TaxID=1133569 RepID=A0A0R2CMB7_9LACO|nr:LacI family DNA-binding transcriptional regulator [Liquorilactobacillus vini]KRM89334.1 maltose operon transcriptional repressor [Liquorilactobacillus vini DSM 20605]
MATIKDVARLAGVSPSTASRVIHDSPLISEPTKIRVRAAMEKLDYSPNFTAQNLANQKTNMVGIVLPLTSQRVVDDPFFLKIIQGITQVCNQHDYLVLLAAGKTSQELLQNVQSMIKRGNIKNFIFTYSSQQDPVLNYVSDQPGINCVLIGKPSDKRERNLKFVDNDNLQAGSDAANFLLGRHFNKLAYVYTDLRQVVQNDRYLGVKQVVDQQTSEQLLCLKLKLDDYLYNRQAFQQLLKNDSQVNGFVACDDTVGIRLQQLLKSSSIAHQTNYGIICFNNSIFSRISHPSLTSVEVFPLQLGERAALLALGLANQEPNFSLIVDHQIIERNSTRN